MLQLASIQGTKGKRGRAPPPRLSKKLLPTKVLSYVVIFGLFTLWQPKAAEIYNMVVKLANLF